MATEKWIYDVIIYIYALSLLFYFSDFMSASRRAKRIGAGLLIFVWGLQTVYLLSKLLSHLQLPEISPFEYWLGFSWLLVTVSLVISRFIAIDYIVFFVNVVGFAVLALNLYSSPSDGMDYSMSDTMREMLYVHISLVLCAYAALTIGALLSGMYMFLHHRLKHKKWSRFVRRFPSLDSIERYVDRTVIVGLPLLAMSLAVAVTSLLVEGREYLLLDWKVLSSVGALIMYIVYVYQRAVNQKPAQQLAKLYLASFAVMLLNVLTSSLSSFH
ncbi:cytochrome c biogenesis protein CcsA [Paenibacillus sp. HB172176]|uniref:cytochrome c biogenesis protein CcsA n=1 Tax=Paenibacillus sp. HB172176 TaxID=2493690 RepID=UPI00143C4EE2|nr:cytochrome c biogenesis protein CcsA [Paenibacillus sp. HB172176]